jgi:hypothetical protein
MSTAFHFNLAILYFAGAAIYILAALALLGEWHRYLWSCYLLIAILYSLVGWTHLFE